MKQHTMEVLGHSCRRIALLGLGGVALVLGGCQGGQQVSPEYAWLAGPPSAAQGPILSLGAGDRLGVAMYQQDVVLAARGAAKPQNALADVPTPIDR